MRDSDTTKDEKTREEASEELTNDQQIIQQVETETQADKEQQEGEETTEIPKVENGQDKVDENKTSKFSMKFTFLISIEKLKLFGFENKHFWF